MDLKTLARGEAWMDDAERRLARRFMRGMSALFNEHGVADTPLLALRVNDVLVSWLLVRRAETGLFPGALDPGDDRAAAAVIEAVSRARERMRKAMKELEDACAKGGTPIDAGLADQVRPILKQAAGLAEEAAARHAERKDADRDGDVIHECFPSGPNAAPQHE